jgi:hypothetical protein
LHNTGQVEEAIKYYSAALRLNAQDFQCMTNYGAALSAVGNGDAEKILKHAITLNPTAEVSYINLLNHLIRKQDQSGINQVLTSAKAYNVVLRPNMVNQLKSMGFQL